MSDRRVGSFVRAVAGKASMRYATCLVTSAGVVALASNALAELDTQVKAPGAAPPAADAPPSNAEDSDSSSSAPASGPPRPGSVPRATTDSDEAITEVKDPPLQLRSDLIELRLGMLLSALADFGWARPQSDDNGFRLTDARIAFVGRLGASWRFLLQADLARAPRPVLDVRLTYEPDRWFRLRGGLFKVPFSAELLAPAAETDLNNRARIVRLLAPNRSVGLELGGRGERRRFFYRLGVFNGGSDLQNDNSHFLYVGRVGTEFELPAGVSLTLGLNAVISEDGVVETPVFDEPFDGRRLLAGGDLRATRGDLFISTEWLYGRFTAGATTNTVSGHHVTVGYLIRPYLQVLLRWDRLDRDDSSGAPNLLIPSVAFIVPDLSPIQLQLDVEIPLEDEDQTRAFMSASVVY